LEPWWKLKQGTREGLAQIKAISIWLGEPTAFYLWDGGPSLVPLVEVNFHNIQRDRLSLSYIFRSTCTWIIRLIDFEQSSIPRAYVLISRAQQKPLGS
jgi:hypothetical protein